jgi:hypothetical protein
MDSWEKNATGAGFSGRYTAEIRDVWAKFLWCDLDGREVPEHRLCLPRYQRSAAPVRQAIPWKATAGTVPADKP